MPDLLLSIVVPTRNRFECARSVVQGFAAVRDDRVELILQDNSTDRGLAQLVDDLADPRIRYFHVDRSLTMHENFDAGLRHAEGRYVCAIGDDDGIIVSAALAVLEQATAQDCDAVLTTIPSFTWPGTIHRLWGESRGDLAEIDPDSRVSDGMLDPRSALEAHFANGLCHSLGWLPRVYQGFVARRSLDALRDRCGTCFPGPSPDIANAVALVPFINRIMCSPQPTIISGHSPRSGGGAGSAGTHHGRLEDQAHLPAGTAERWDPAIPRFWSGPTIYAQSALIACVDSEQILPPIGYDKLYATCIVYERPRYWRDVLQAMREAPVSHPVLAVRTVYQIARLFVRRAANLVRNAIDRKFSKPAGEQFADIDAVMREGERRFASDCPVVTSRLRSPSAR